MGATAALEALLVPSLPRLPTVPTIVELSLLSLIQLMPGPLGEGQQALMSVESSDVLLLP